MNKPAALRYVNFVVFDPTSGAIARSGHADYETALIQGDHVLVVDYELPRGIDLTHLVRDGKLIPIPPTIDHETGA